MAADIIKAVSVPFAMAVIGVLAWKALSMGINGALFMTVVAVIGGLGGYEVKTLVEKVKLKTPDKKK